MTGGALVADVAPNLLVDAGETLRRLCRAAERVALERHTELGRELLADTGTELLDLAATIAWTHHERWDGGGYPRRLIRAAIPLPGRIVALADVFDAIASERSVDEAVSIVLAQRCVSFDPDVVDAFLGVTA